MAADQRLRLPGYVAPEKINQPDARTINRLVNQRPTETYSGFGWPVPVVYGEEDVGGPRLVDPFPMGNGYVWAVAISKGPIEAILQVRVKAGAWLDLNQNNTTQLNVSGTGVTIYRRYLGDQNTPDPTLAGAIANYADVYPGTAYVVVGYVPQTGDTALPDVQFRVRGRKCADPRFPHGKWAAVDAGFGTSTVRALAVGGTAANPTVLAAGDDGKLASRQGAGAWISRDAGFGAAAVLAVSAGASNSWGAAGAGGLTARGANVNANNWNPIPALPGWGDMHALAFGRNLHVVGGAGGLAATRATSGTSWTGINPGMGNVTIRAALGTSSMLMLAGDNGQLSTNTSGSTWIPRDPGLGQSQITALATDGTACVAFAVDGMLSITRDSGETWELGEHPFSEVNAAAHAEGLWVIASGDGRFAVSRDLQDWRVHDSPTGTIIRAMTYTGEQLIVAGDNGTMATGTNLLGEVWTENPALHMLDFVTATWGLNREAKGFTEAADACDSLFSGVPRALAGQVIQAQMAEEDALALLQTPAEVFVGWDGDAVSVIPDMPVDEPIEMIPANQIIHNSIKLSCSPASAVPASVTVHFRARDESGEWTTRPETDSAPPGDVPASAYTRSDLQRPDIKRRVQARRVAAERRVRLQTTGQIAWRMMALGGTLRPGMVRRMPNIRGLVNAAVRITAQPELVAPGVYQLQGVLYNRAQYMDDGGGTSVPLGGIVPYFGALPNGYQAWTGSGYLIGDATGGQQLPATAGSLTLSFGSAGAHVGARATDTRAPSGSGGPTGIYLTIGSSDEPRGSHPHSATMPLASLLDAAPLETLQWAKKTGSAGTLQAGVGFLAARAINAQRISAVMSAVGKYLAAGTRASRPGRTSIGGQTSEDGDHYHGGDLFEVGSGTSTLTVYQQSGKHRHQWSANIRTRLRSKRLALYQATDEALIYPGGIIGWEDGAVPSGWRLCNGSGGTIDLRGFFIELALPEDAGTVASETSEIALTNIGTDSVGVHNHQRTLNNINVVNFGMSNRHGMESHLHAHTAANRTIPNVLPARRTLRFIQYVGSN